MTEANATGCYYLEAGVQEAAQQWVFHLLDNLCSSLLGIVLRHHGGQAVHIEGVFSDSRENTDQYISTGDAVFANSIVRRNNSCNSTDLLSW